MHCVQGTVSPSSTPAISTSSSASSSSTNSSASTAAGAASQGASADEQQWLDWIIDKMRGPMGKQVVKRMMADTNRNVSGQDVAQMIDKLQSDPAARKHIIQQLKANASEGMNMAHPEMERKVRLPGCLRNAPHAAKICSCFTAWLTCDYACPVADIVAMHCDVDSL